MKKIKNNINIIIDLVIDLVMDLELITKQPNNLKILDKMIKNYAAS